MPTCSAVSFALAASTLGAVLAGPAPAERPRALVQGALGRRLDEVLRRYHEYGLSGTVLVAKERGRDVIRKGGGMPDFASHLVHYSREGLVVIFATNDLGQRWRQTLLKALPAVVFGEEPPLPPPIASVGVDALARLAGRFRTASGALVEVHAHEGFLSLGQNTLAVPPSVPFYAQSPTSFTGLDVQRAALVSLRFEMDAGGNLTRLRIGSDSGSGSDTASRVP